MLSEILESLCHKHVVLVAYYPNLNWHILATNKQQMVSGLCGSSCILPIVSKQHCQTSVQEPP